MPAPLTQRVPRIAIAALLALLALAGGARSASAQEVVPSTLTVRVGTVPATDAGRFDLAIDGVALALGVGDGGTTGARTVLPGSFVVSEGAAAGTALVSYSTALTCTDGADVLVSAPLAAAAVTVAAGHDVVCTFVNTLLPLAQPVAATPILLPPAFVRGTAILRGVEGCTNRSMVTSRVIGRNIARLVFVRDGRVIKRVKAPSLDWRAYELRTRLPSDDLRTHVVRVWAYFVSGATPRVKAMVHRFGHCRASAVAG